MKFYIYIVALVLPFGLSACMTSAANEDQRKPAAVVTVPQVCSNNYVNTQYGCIPQNNCPAGQGNYNNNCYPALQPYSSSNQTTFKISGKGVNADNNDSLACKRALDNAISDATSLCHGFGGNTNVDPSSYSLSKNYVGWGCMVKIEATCSLQF